MKLVTDVLICISFCKERRGVNDLVLHFRVASDQNLDSTEGLQKAAKRLQAAAGIFGHLKDHAVAAIQV